MAYTPFKMKGHTLPGINQKSEGNTDLPDGRSGSSAFQYKSPAKDYKKGYYGEGKSKSPSKWVQYIPMALSFLSSMKKDKEEKE